jgi:surface antigen
MNKTSRIHRFAATSLALLFAAAGCQNLNNTENGALTGGGLGALLGAIIGHQTGHAAGGAAIGALAGGVTGGLIGNAEDSREQRDAAMARAYQAEQARQAAAVALTNADLVNMSQKGISDEVIINSVRTRGGQFDLSPDAIIGLKSQGVSDRVILEVQKIGEAAPAPTVVHSGSPAYVVDPGPQVVIVRPVPPPPSVGFGVYYGPARPYYRGRGYYYRRW